MVYARPIVILALLGCFGIALNAQQPHHIPMKTGGRMDATEMARHKATMDSIERKVDSLVAVMNATPEASKGAAAAAVLSQFWQMHKSMHQMMGNMGMMGGARMGGNTGGCGGAAGAALGMCKSPKARAKADTGQKAKPPA